MSENAPLPACEGEAGCTQRPPPPAGERRNCVKDPGELKFGRRFFAALAASIVFGGAGGLILGANTGVKPALEAGTRVDAAALAQALPWKREIASGSSARLDLARLLDEMRSLRAQIEQLRHNDETSRASERLHALKTSRESAAGGEPTLNRAIAEMGMRLGEIESRLSRLERAGADATPVGAVRPAAPTDAPFSSRARAGARAR